VSGKGKRDVLLNRLRGGSVAGDASEAIKEEDSSDDEDIFRTDFAKIVEQTKKEDQTSEEPQPKKKMKKPVASNESITSPVLSMFKSAGSIVSKGLNMLSPKGRKKEPEVIEILGSDDDDADSVATPNVPQNIDVIAPHSAAMSVLSPGDDHSVMSTLSTARRPSRPKRKPDKRSGRPPKPSSQAHQRKSRQKKRVTFKKTPDLKRGRNQIQ